MTQREGGWWPRGQPKWGSTRQMLREEVLLVVAVVLSLVVGVLAAVVAVLAASVVTQSFAGPDVAAGVGVQLVAWGLLVGLVLLLPFGLLAAVVALAEYGEGRSARRRLRRTRPPVATSADGETGAPADSGPPGSAGSTGDERE